jgi:ATP-dependent Clp protease ATP-binding subunit ClpA
VHPFERFTEKAKKVLTLAQDEAEKSHQSYIHTEHLLLGLLREGDGLAAKVLANLGVEINTVRTAVGAVLDRNERITRRHTPTSRVKKVLEIAFEEAKRMNNSYVGTEHLLLGLLIEGEGEGVAAKVLEDLGVNLEKVRNEVVSFQPPPPTAGVAGPDPPSRVHLTSGSHEDLPHPASGGGATRYASFLPQRVRPTAPAAADGINLSAAAKSALALCEEEALRSGTGVIETDHLLLGLIRQGQGRAATVLQQLV